MRAFWYHGEISTFESLYARLVGALLLEDPVDVGEVHAQDVRDKPEWVSRELQNVVFEYPIPRDLDQLAKEVQPNLPWADEHFQERVSYAPLNPPPSAARWPFAQRGHEDHLKGEKFSHTYPERFWPAWAGEEYDEMANSTSVAWEPRHGIRFKYGDLGDLLTVLAGNPLTRQAYLPVWFPEDLTAAVQGERVPCTLGYHFLMRDGKLHVTYFIRSCDIVRFFRDDVYMACCLVQWVIEQLGDFKPPNTKYTPDPLAVEPGNLTMHITSLHCFEGDLPRLEKYASSRT